MRWMSLVGALVVGLGAVAGDGRVPEAALAAMERLYPTVPSAENGALKFLAAYDALIPFNVRADVSAYAIDATGFPSPLATIHEDAAQAMAAYLAANRESLQLLREASALTRFRYPVDFSEGEHVGLAHLAVLRELARLSALNAVMAAHRGDGEEAVRAVGDTAVVARSLTAEPAELSQFMRYLCGDITLLAMEHIVNRVALDAEALDELQRTAASLEEPASLVAMLEGVKWMSSLPLASENEVDWSVLDDTIGKLSGNLDLGTAVGEDNESEAAEQKSDVDLEAAARQARLDEATAYLGRVDMPLEDLYEYVRFPEGYGPSAAGVVTAHEFGSLRRPILAYIRFMARARVAQTALSLQRYQLANGELPEKLADLVPDYVAPQTLVDPCGGDGLRYTVKGDRAEVYSVADAVFNAIVQCKDPEAPSAICFAVRR